jgi:hypothetical protein
MLLNNEWNRKGIENERFNRCLHTWCNSWRNVRPLNMIETVMIVFAIGVFALFATVMLIAGIFLFWINK